MPPTEDKRKAARETIDILYEISSLLVSLYFSFLSPMSHFSIIRSVTNTRVSPAGEGPCFYQNNQLTRPVSLCFSFLFFFLFSFLSHVYLCFYSSNYDFFYQILLIHTHALE
jgi:hypothetical protein